MLKHLVGLASWRKRTYMTHRSAVTGLVSDSIAFNFPTTLLISSDIRSYLQLVNSISHKVNGATSSTSTELQIIDFVAVLSWREEEIQIHEPFQVLKSFYWRFWWNTTIQWPCDGILVAYLANLQVCCEHTCSGELLLSYSHKILQFSFFILVHPNLFPSGDDKVFKIGSRTLSCTEETVHWCSPAGFPRCWGMWMDALHSRKVLLVELV